MKRILPIALILTFTFLLFSCGGNQPNVKQPAAEEIKLFETMLDLHRVDSPAFVNGEIIKVEPLDGRWDVLNVVVSDRLSSLTKAEKEFWLSQNVKSIEGLGRSTLYPEEAASDRVIPKIQVTYENGDIMAVSGLDKMTYKVY